MRGRPFQLVPPEPGEHELQAMVTKMLNTILLPDVQWTSIDHAHTVDMTPGRNGQPIGLIEMGKRKARGIKSGIFDLLFWHRGRGFAIELKVGDNDLTPKQIEFGEGLIRAQIPIKVCWNVDQVFNTVVAWGLARNVRVAA